MPVQHVFDFLLALSHLDGDEDLLREVAREFVSGLPRRMAQLGELIEHGAYAEARTMTHGLRGAAATLAAQGARDAALELELACAARDQPATLHAWDGFRFSIEELTGVLRGVFGEPASLSRAS